MNFMELGFVAAFNQTLRRYNWELEAPKINFGQFGIVGSLKLIGEED